MARRHNIGARILVGIWGAFVFGCGGNEREPTLAEQTQGQGFYKRCIEDGAIFDAKFASDPCCEGLKRIELFVESDSPEALGEPGGLPAGCDIGPYPDSAKLCASCGNGMCAEHENRCNCPEDCV
jgi:hypothetical protein